MPWYYAGPEAKPVGPLSVEELHARHAGGVVTNETYVIEHMGQPGADWSWKCYRDVFPTNLPPVPPPATIPPAAAPHPLFPSAAPASAGHPVFTSPAGPDPYYKVKPTNGWCAWGFCLGLAGFVFSLACGIGLLLALPSLLLCIVGLVQVHKNREQSGQGLAIAGIVLSILALIVALIMIFFVDLKMFKAHQLTITEQTTNDSE